MNKFFFIFWAFLGSALLSLASTGEDKLFTDNITILTHQSSDGRLLRAERLDANNPTHYEAAKLLDTAGAAETQAGKTPGYTPSLLSMFSPSWENHSIQKILMPHYLRAMDESHCPLHDYIVFGGENPLAVFGFGVPAGFVSDINLDNFIKALGEDDASCSLEKEQFPFHAPLLLYVLPEHRGKGIGSGMVSMVYSLVDSMQGKRLRVPQFIPESGTFSLSWTYYPLLGCKSDTGLSKVGSVLCHLEFPDELDKIERVQVLPGPDLTQEVTFLYPKGPDASDESMRELKEKIREARKQYKEQQKTNLTSPDELESVGSACKGSTI